MIKLLITALLYTQAGALQASATTTEVRDSKNQKMPKIEINGIQHYQFQKQTQEDPKTRRILQNGNNKTLSYQKGTLTVATSPTAFTVQIITSKGSTLFSTIEIIKATFPYSSQTKPGNSTKNPYYEYRTDSAEYTRSSMFSISSKKGLNKSIWVEQLQGSIFEPENFDHGFRIGASQDSLDLNVSGYFIEGVWDFKQGIKFRIIIGFYYTSCFIFTILMLGDQKDGQSYPIYSLALVAISYIPLLLVGVFRAPFSLDRESYYALLWSGVLILLTLVKIFSLKSAFFNSTRWVMAVYWTISALTFVILLFFLPDFLPFFSVLVPIGLFLENAFYCRSYGRVVILMGISITQNLVYYYLTYYVYNCGGFIAASGLAWAISVTVSTTLCFAGSTVLVLVKGIENQRNIESSSLYEEGESQKEVMSTFRDQRGGDEQEDDTDYENGFRDVSGHSWDVQFSENDYIQFKDELKERKSHNMANKEAVR